jgi:hypothetical protein
MRYNTLFKGPKSKSRSTTLCLYAGMPFRCGEDFHDGAKS